VTTHSGLRERHFGDFQGLSFEQIQIQLPEDARLWSERKDDWAPPGGGESLASLRDRVLRTVDDLAARHVGQQIVLVTHGGVLDILYRAACSLDLTAPRTWTMTNTAVNRLLWTEQGLSMERWGDTSHLDGRDGRDEVAA